MSPVQTRSRSSLIASAPMKEMTLLKHSTSLKRGRVNFNPRSSLSSSSSASSSTCPAATAARRGGKMACRNKVLKELIRQKTALMGLELNVCGSMNANNEARHESATASTHAAGCAGNGNGLLMDEGVKGDVLWATGNRERDACAGTVETLQAAGAQEEWWDEESCTTPKAPECRIPADAGLACPPAPRKRKAVARLDHTCSPFSTLSGSGVSSPRMILPHFIDAFFCSAEDNGGSF